MPVLMVRPEERSIEMDEHPLYSHVLIPLDGSTAAELALEDAVSLGGLAHARYTLARVVAPVLVPVHSYAMSGAAVRPDEDATSAEMQAAREYLEQQAARLGETGLRVQTTVRLGGHPAETVLSVARDVQADLIAMCTHRHGAARFIMGSVADKVLRGGDLPLHLMRPRGAAGG
jgi:nucleotide-binding universal stress UspA family protein